jgi:NifU-like protein
VAAFRAALAEYRSKVIEEFKGERALICTCFGVSEDTIIKTIERDAPTDISEVSAACKAGTGCGSCRMLIQELIDSYRHNSEGETVL